MKKIFVLLFLVVLVVSGCGERNLAVTDSQTTAPFIDVTTPLETVVDDELLSNYFSVQTTREFDVVEGEFGYVAVALIEHMNDHLPNRLAFSDRELESAEWIVETLLEMGFDESQIEMQNFNVDTQTSSWWGEAYWMVDWFKDAGYYDEVEFTGYSQNVILTLPGRSTETIIIGAHYDGMANEGMSDNAGGTVLLLENAYRMRQVDHYYTLQYVFFGAEEVGLIGSFYFSDQMQVSDIDNLILMINADVIIDGPDLIYAIGYTEPSLSQTIEILWDGPEIRQNELTMQVKNIAARLNAENNLDLISKPHALFLPSDQLAFVSLGIPLMVFYATHPVEYPQVMIGDVLHTPDDNLDFLIQNHPGRVERALHDFGLFLEAIVSSENLQ